MKQKRGCWGPNDTISFFGYTVYTRYIAKANYQSKSLYLSLSLSLSLVMAPPIGVLLYTSLTALFFSIIFRIARAVIGGRSSRNPAVGFFHPYTNDGGGGERVLWCAVKAIQEEYPNLDCVVYTGDSDASPQTLIARAIDRFGVALLRPPKVVHLCKRKWIEESTYPRFTMIGQSFGSIYLSWEALCKLTPLFYFDTCGYAFTYPLARMFGCQVICYTHYPTISTNMLARVSLQSSMYNNNALIARSRLLSQCKVIYYTVFSWMYGFVGSCANLAMVNSSWTQSHIEKLWKIPERTRRVYPPCDTSGLQVLPLERPSGSPKIISVAQFRPEKAHIIQLEAFSVAIRQLDSELPRPKLQFVGGCRNKEDEERLQNLKDKAIELNVGMDVEFHKNVMYKLFILSSLLSMEDLEVIDAYSSYQLAYLFQSAVSAGLQIVVAMPTGWDLVKLLGGALAGIHSMIDEHFGISVVEYMAAGAIPIANNSAGPKMDIVLDEDGQQTGFLAGNMEEYAEAIVKLLKMPETQRLEMAAAARKRSSRFSEQRFYNDFKEAIRPILSQSSYSS
ncbi:hypothetical protein Sjap_011398 [Stephania japonica]|uniref:GDP-Man:Man(3)GlcNAc(2)-PP-Dol alpha-1,2-mannosyltransferase n=1 Tax=Stephania japonica TaxID=461633 RepID=A0AAP0JBB4_9MAGN